MSELEIAELSSASSEGEISEGISPWRKAERLPLGM
jgi:hypothetical protein